MFHFVASLKPYTIDPELRRSHFASYLLSVDYAAGTRTLLQRVYNERRILVADNGNFDRIGKLLTKLAPSAKSLAEARNKQEYALGRYARPGDLSKTMRDAYTSFAKRIAKVAAAEREKDYVHAVVQAQVALSPSYLIGMEDFTIPLLVGLDVERAYANLTMSFFTEPADRAIAYAKDTRNGAFGPCTTDVFAGLHAIDLDTARTIGKRAGDAKVDGIAVGLGSALDDRDFTDYRIERGKLVPLGAATPRSYVRVLEIAAGVHLGFAEATGHRPRFHALGVGTPILLPLLAVLGDRRTYTATDSTAPIKDAYSSATIALYVDRPAPLKLKAYVITERWLDGGTPWHCGCPHCLSFLKKHPFQINKARAWWVMEGKRALTPTDMWAPSPLAEYLPLLTMSKNSELRKRAGLTRVAHNHWILQRLEAAIRRRSRTASELGDWVETVVEKYIQGGSGIAWKAATKAAWSIARSASTELKGVGPGGDVIPTRSR